MLVHLPVLPSQDLLHAWFLFVFGIHQEHFFSFCFQKYKVLVLISISVGSV